MIAVEESALALKPNNITLQEAASLPLVALTAWQVLVETARLKKGQKVFIHAGSGGVGTVAIQLAKHLGAFVATTTSTSNVAWVKALGADVVIDYTRSPRIATVLDPSTEITAQDLHDTLRDREDDAENQSYPILIDSAGKEPLGGGVSVGITATLQAYRDLIYSDVEEVAKVCTDQYYRLKEYALEPPEA